MGRGPRALQGGPRDASLLLPHSFLLEDLGGTMKNFNLTFKTKYNVLILIFGNRVHIVFTIIWHFQDRQ